MQAAVCPSVDLVLEGTMGGMDLLSLWSAGVLTCTCNGMGSNWPFGHPTAVWGPQTHWLCHSGTGSHMLVLAFPFAPMLGLGHPSV